MSTEADIRSTYVLTLELEPADSDALADWLRDDMGLSVVELARPGHPRIWMEAFFTSDIEAALVESMAKTRANIAASRVRRMDPREWNSFWRHHFHAHAVGDRLWICPVWEKDRARRPDRETILVDPGLSFGTGDHFTTRFCLEMMDQLCQKFALASMLDVGTGTGILAIAAARLGCERVLAVDNDAQAIAHARDNIQMNGVSDRIELQVMDILNTTPKASFDMVCANLYGQVLVDAAPALARCANHHLIVSGIRELEMETVSGAMTAQGGREVVRDGDGEWGGLLIAMDESS